MWAAALMLYPIYKIIIIIHLHRGESNFRVHLLDFSLNY